jgi:hypothetical protein
MSDKSEEPGADVPRLEFCNGREGAEDGGEIKGPRVKFNSASTPPRGAVVSGQLSVDSKENADASEGFGESREDFLQVLETNAC